MVIDRCVGDEGRARRNMGRSASKSTIVSGFDSDQNLTSENRSCQFVDRLCSPAIGTAHIERVLADDAQLVR